MADEPPHDPPRVRATYERIARDFDRTRSRPWPAVEAFVGEADRAGIALDLGCGNGRHLPVLARRADAIVAVDLSRAMLDIARRRSLAVPVDHVEGAARWLPLRADTVGLAIYVATLHHLATRADRIASLDDLARVMAPGAEGLVSVWSITHERFAYEAATDAIVDWTLPDGTVVPRYYHLYDRPTFAAELDASVLDVGRIWAHAGNLYARVAPRE